MHRERVIVTVDEFHGAPLQLVETAAAQRSADLRAAKRGKGDAYDQYWCVFDVDEHPYVDQALQLAASSQISIAVTNPCIELWFLLHFRDQTADLHRHNAQEISSGLLGCAKVPTAAALIQLVGRYEDARRRAQALDRKHELDGSPSGSNPSSSLWFGPRLADEPRQVARRAGARLPEAEDRAGRVDDRRGIPAHAGPGPGEHAGDEHELPAGQVELTVFPGRVEAEHSVRRQG